jgi:hypothetical protein
LTDTRRHRKKEARDGAPAAVGLACRACGCRHLEVVYTRPHPGGILRRRQCRHCGRRLTTVERLPLEGEPFPGK